MKRILALSSIILLAALQGNLYAQKNKSESDYNLKKAYEVLNEEQNETKGLELVNKQLLETPDNIEALLLRINLLRRSGDYAQAMRDINHAIRVNKPKKSEIPNSTLYWWKGYIYDDMGDEQNAAASLRTAYELAYKENAENLQDISFSYAQALYGLGDYSGSDTVYRKMLAKDEADLGAMVGLARNMIMRGENQDALELLDRCQNYSADYSEVYRFKMQAYDQLNESIKAIDAALDWLEKDDDASVRAILSYLKKRPNYAEASIKTRLKKSDKPIVWKIWLCHFYEGSYKYAKAVHLYDEIEKEIGPYSEIYESRSNCYDELGFYQKAIEDITKALEENIDWTNLCTRGEYYRKSGDLDDAISDFSSAIEEEPAQFYSYFCRGWCYELKGMRRKALEDYNVGIELYEDYPYLYLMRGRVLLSEGMKAEAKKDFEEVLKKDVEIDGGSCRQFALHFLGQDEEAEEWMSAIIKEEPEESWNYYNQACLYSLIGKSKESISALRTAFEKGFRSFAQLRMDSDLDSIRDLFEFNDLIAEYQAIQEDYQKQFVFEEKVPQMQGVVSEISMKRNPGGTFEVPCEINGLALQMIFDTGASDVSISSVEATFMLKNGYLSEKDIKGKKYYQTANGQISEGTTVTLREVRLGNAVLHNVDASVVNSQSAPLLLGQSAMERFGIITIDNQNNKLIINH